MGKLSDLLKSNFYPRKAAIHDCVDTGADLALTAANTIDFPCDCVSRDYKSTTTTLWNKTTSLIKDTVDNAEMRVKIKMTLNGAVNNILTMDVFVPHPTLGDIPIDNIDFVLYKNNLDTNFTGFLLLYNGTDSEARTHGFKVQITASGNMTLKARSILITA
jgi:hypothetical protein